MSEPWASYGGGMGWEHPSMMPGLRAQLARLDQLEAAERRREEEERQARAEDRREAWRFRRMQELAWRGVPFDPSDDRTLAQSTEEFCGEVWARMDAEDARNLRRAMVEAGLLADLGPRFAPDEPTPEPEAEASFRSGWRARLGRITKRSSSRPPSDWVPYSHRSKP